MLRYKEEEEETGGEGEEEEGAGKEAKDVFSVLQSDHKTSRGQPQKPCADWGSEAPPVCTKAEVNAMVS